MLEALAHQQLKALLRLEGETRWPHHLTLSRLAARSLRRADQTLVRLAPGSDPSWLLALLVPIALTDTGLALVVSPGLRQRLLQVELPRLEAAGLVTRTPDPEDARAVRIQITADGSAVLAQVRADRAAVIDPFIETLSDSDRRVLTAAVGALQRLVDDLAGAD